MKIYHDHDSDGTWTEITGITAYPTITTRINTVGRCNVIIGDFEGALYATWKDYDNIPMKIEDDNSNVIFRGYLDKKQFRAKELELSIAGLGVLLEKNPFYKNYILEEGKIASNPIPATSVLEMYDDIDEDNVDDGAAENFSWTADQWITPIQDVGLLIVDNTNTIDSKTWYCSAIGVTNCVEEAGDKDSLDAAYDVPEDVYHASETGVTWDGYITPTMTAAGGDEVAKTKVIDHIDIAYRYGFKATVPLGGSAKVRLKIKNSDSDWTIISEFGLSSTIDYYLYPEGTKTITDTHANLIKFLTADNGNWDECLELRLEFIHSGIAAVGNVKIDLLTVTIHYEENTITPIMVPITDNAAETLTCSSVTWDETGVNTNDIFKIGQNTVQIVSDISEAAGIPILIQGEDLSGSATATLRPDGDSAVTWSFDDSGGDGSHWKDLDEVVVDPNAGDGNVIYTSDEESDIFTMGTNAMGGANVCTQIDLHVYSKRSAFLSYPMASFFTTSTGYSTEKNACPVFNPAAYAWCTLTWTDLNLDQADIDSMLIKFRHDETLGAGTSYIDCFYVVITYGALSPFDKYIARIFRGTYCIDALKSVCKLEGADWIEDYPNNRIKLVKPDSYPDSGEAITSSNYDFDWEFEDNCNQVVRVDVWGNASYNIHAWKENPDPDVYGFEMNKKQYIDEGIGTQGDAQEVADQIYDNLNAKRPSLKLTLNGVNSALNTGESVNVTLERPTIAADDYPIRMIERALRGIDGIKTVIYCGLGKTKADEKIGASIREIGYLANRALSDRLITTPWTGGANITWSDVGGADAGAVAAVLADDAYLKNDANDTTTGDLTVANLITAGTVDGVDISATQYNRIQLERNPISAAGWVNDYVQLNAVNEDCSTSFYVGSYVDATVDIVVTFIHTCTSADATVACKWYVDSSATDGSEAITWNIENGTAFNADSTVANKKYKTEYTIANAGVAAGDDITIRFRLNEAARDVRIYGISLLYKRASS